VGPPALPAGAPPDLVAFVACRADEVVLTNAKVSWLPAPDVVPKGLGRILAPRLAIHRGPEPGSAELAIGWGPVKLRLHAGVVDGALVLTPAASPPPGLAGVVSGFDSWATQLNRWLASHRARLAPPEVSPGRLVLTKIVANS